MLTQGPGLVYGLCHHTSTCFGNYSQSVPMSGFQRTSQGALTSGFKRKQRSGVLLPVLPWTQTEWTLERSGGYRASSPECSWAGGAFYDRRTPYRVSDAHIQEVVNSVDTSRLLQDAAAGLSADFDALTFLAEAKHLRPMILGAMNRILATLRTVDFYRQLKRGADLYLEARYGWRPLWYDLQNIWELVSEWNDKHGEFLRKRREASISQSFTDVIRENTLQYHHGPHVLQVYTLESVVSVSGRGFLTVKANRPKVMVNPIVTAWELVTLSFVLDWFVNVGNAIQAASNVLVHSEVASGVGLLVDIDSRLTSTWATDTPNCSCSCDVSSVYTETRVTRTPQGVSLAPKMNVRLDDWKIADMVSIMYQRIYSELTKARRR